MSEERNFKLKWDGEDIAPLFEYVAAIGSKNVESMVFDSETKLLTVYPKGESEAKGGGESFNFVIFCPPAPAAACEGQT